MLCAFGWRNGWINRYEAIFSLGLLALVYFTRGWDTYMMGHARYAATCLPLFQLLGILLNRIHPIISFSVLGMSIFYLFHFFLQYCAGKMVT